MQTGFVANLRSARPLILNNSWESVTVNFAPSYREAMYAGRKHIVVPMTMIVPGVLPGSRGPLLYTPPELARNFRAWDGVPITLDHPLNLDGTPTSAKEKGVWERVGLGVVRNTRYEGKLIAEGWLDLQKTRSIAPSIVANIMHGRPIELSTGLFTDNHPSTGTYNGKSYTHIARNFRPDHLAILLGKQGACSLNDGCGVGVLNQSVVDAKNLSVRKLTANEFVANGYLVTDHSILISKSDEVHQ
jgi:hypothetical protein